MSNQPRLSDITASRLLQNLKKAAVGLSSEQISFNPIIAPDIAHLCYLYPNVEKEELGQIAHAFGYTYSQFKKGQCDSTFAAQSVPFQNDSGAHQLALLISYRNAAENTNFFTTNFGQPFVFFRTVAPSLAQEVAAAHQPSRGPTPLGE